MRAAVFTVAGLIATSLTAHAAEPVSLKGLTVGMTRLQIEERFPWILAAGCIPKMEKEGRLPCGYMPPSRDIEHLRKRYEQLDTLAGARTSSWFFPLHNDKIASIAVAMSTDEFNRVVAALTEKYGEPSNRSVSAIQNRMGATFEQIEVTWQVGTDTLVATKRARNVDTMSLYLSSQAGREEFSKQREEQPKKDAKDL